MVAFLLPWQPGDAAPKPGPRQPGWNLGPRHGSPWGWHWDESWATCGLLRGRRMLVPWESMTVSRLYFCPSTDNYFYRQKKNPQQLTNPPNSHLQMKAQENQSEEWHCFWSNKWGALLNSYQKQESIPHTIHDDYWYRLLESASIPTPFLSEHHCCGELLLLPVCQSCQIRCGRGEVKTHKDDSESCWHKDFLNGGLSLIK